MRASKYLLVLGLLVFFFLGGLLFFAMPVRTGTSVVRVVRPASEVVVPPEVVETVVEPVMALGPLVVAGVVILALLVVVGVLVFQLRARDAYLKRKREDVALPDAYLADMADDGMLHLDDDGELPKWVETVADDRRKQA